MWKNSRTSSGQEKKETFFRLYCVHLGATLKARQVPSHPLSPINLYICRKTLAALSWCISKPRSSKSTSRLSYKFESGLNNVGKLMLWSKLFVETVPGRVQAGTRFPKSSSNLPPAPCPYHAHMDEPLFVLALVEREKKKGRSRGKRNGGEVRAGSFAVFLSLFEKSKREKRAKQWKTRRDSPDEWVRERTRVSLRSRRERREKRKGTWI